VAHGLGDLDAARVAGRDTHVHTRHGDVLVDADDACTKGQAAAVLSVHVVAGANCCSTANRLLVLSTNSGDKTRSNAVAAWQMMRLVRLQRWIAAGTPAGCSACGLQHTSDTAQNKFCTIRNRDQMPKVLHIQRTASNRPCVQLSQALTGA
jgi:hypothetical protein